MAKKDKLVLVDGSAVFHRAYHAIPHLTNSKGEPTNAVYGFTMMLLKVLSDLKPTYAIVAWDKSSKTFRKDMYKEYKANRVKQPDDLYEQIPATREVVKAMGLPFIEVENYEADDIIGTLAAKAGKLETIIVTGDLDELQLIDDHTKVYTMRKGITDTVIYDAEAVIERYGVTPEQFVDLKALKGDASDNIPGVKGIGEKTATTLIAKYDSLDGVYKHLDKIGGRTAQLLKDDKEMAYLSQELSQIVCDMKLTLDLKSAELGHYNRQAIHALFRELDFKSLLDKLPAEVSNSPSLFDPEPKAPDRAHLGKAKYFCIDDSKKLSKLAADLSKQKIFAFDTETDSLDVMQAKLVGMSFSWKEGEAYYVPVGHSAGKQLSIKEALAVLGPILADPKIAKAGHNIKFDYEIMSGAGVKMAGIAFDTMVASFLLNPLARSRTLDDLAYSEFGIEMIPIEEMIGKRGKGQSTFNFVAIEDATTYASEDADITWRLYAKMAPQLAKTKLKKLAEETEWPLIAVLAEMELAGIELDEKFLSAFNKDISAKILKLEADIWKQAGEHFNIASPAQLGRILYEKLAIKSEVGVIKKGKTGLSTAASELEKMKDAHPIIELILQYRELVKLKNTYVDALPKMISPVDHRIHTSFSQTIAQTGRLSSNNPNLQNIPVRTELGREIRKAFVAPKGRALISADYSQFELRIAAALSGDKAMIKALKDGVDIHQQTAAELYGVAYDKVTKDQRYNAKTVNFGVLYGMSAHGLSVGTGMTREEAAEFIKRYYDLRPGLAKFVEKIKVDTRKNEYAETLLGRRRPLSEINSNNFQISSAAERMAINVPIQGSQADIMKLAMIELYPKLGDDSKLLLQIHDELIVEAPEAKAEAVAKLMKDVMEKVYDLGVPIEVDTSIGKDWGEL
ncbi:MAG TPA: DNA polymerase I [Candidatus Saccharimonadales bacterium]|nr:DNA polymerase I [Candidatus Saccharimonadales bacterium]